MATKAFQDTSKRAIVFIIDNLGSGGAQRIVANLAREIGTRKEFNSIIILFNAETDQFYEVQDMNVIVVKKSLFLWPVIAQIKILLTVFKIKPEAIYACQSSGILASALVLLFTKFKVVACEYTLSVRDSRSWRRQFTNLAIRWCYGVIVNSNAQLTYVTKFSRGSNIHKINNGYDLNTFSNNDLPGRQLLYRESKGESAMEATFERDILVVGRVADVKDGETLVRALLYIWEKYNKSFRVTWLGRQEFDGASLQMRERMESLLAENSFISTGFQFLGEVTNVNDYYKSSEMLVLCSKWEGQPNVVCEAMLSGCTVVSSNVSDVPEFLEDGRGLVFSKGDHIHLAERIWEMKNIGHKKRAEMIENAKHYAVANFSIVKVVDEYLNAIN